jgi:hypothetical protein
MHYIEIAIGVVILEHSIPISIAIWIWIGIIRSLHATYHAFTIRTIMTSESMPNSTALN